MRCLGNLSRLKLVSCAAKFPASSTVLSVLCNVLLHRSRYHYYGLAVKDSSPYFNPAITRKDLYSHG